MRTTTCKPERVYKAYKRVATRTGRTFSITLEQLLSFLALVSIAAKPFSLVASTGGITASATSLRTVAPAANGATSLSATKMGEHLLTTVSASLTTHALSKIEIC
jgi:hypothetical protein